MIDDILLAVESLSNEKGVEKGVIFEAIEAALATVTAKTYDEEVDIRVAIDRDTGEYETFRRWTVVPDDYDLENEDAEPEGKIIFFAAAKNIDPDLEVGDVIEEGVESVEPGRIGSQQAKQVIIQKVREAERSKTSQQYVDRVGEVITGVVKKVTRDYVLLDFGDNVEGMVKKEELIPREAVRMNDRMRAILYEVSEEKRGPQLLLSRTRPEMLVSLFKVEVPEINEEVIQIMSAARDPGSRAKIAVKTNDGRIDPIGACVGMRGSRVQAVSGELNGERIDIILWDDDPARLVINAMAPADVSSIVVDEDTKSMDIGVPEEQLSQAIGRNGQNVRLASELTGWTLNVMSSSEAEQQSESESERSKDVFVAELDVDEEVANILIQEGFSTLEEIAYVLPDELLEIEEFDEEIVEELQTRAKEAIVARKEREPDVKPAQDLVELKGMTPELANNLAAAGIICREDLAEKSVDDVVEIEGMNDELAAKLIMVAREPWFSGEEQEAEG